MPWNYFDGSAGQGKALSGSKYRLASGLPVLVLCLTVSCTPFSPKQRAATDVPLAGAYSVQNPDSIPRQDRWWETFGDHQLNQLVEETLAANLSLQVYWARLEQTRALAVQTGADLYPALTAEAKSSVSRQRTTDSTTKTSGLEEYSFGVAASYELDVWGRVRATRQSARLTAEASREDLNAVAVTKAAEVTERWINIVSQRRQKQLLEQQLAANTTYLDLVELRFRKSLASALDVFQQRQLVEQVRARIPLVEQQETLLLQELAVLLGRAPQAFPEITRQRLPELDAPPATGLPVDLLGARPDVRAAFQRLVAADYQLAAARADRLPALRLTGRAAYAHDDLDRLLDNWILNLAGSLSAPLIDGGRRRAEVVRTRAVVKEGLALYRETVLTAVQEVEAALVRETKIREHLDRLAGQLQAARNALDQARSRYMKGLNDYLPVLTQLLAVQGLEKDIIERRAELLVARVSLHRALGTAWTDELTPPATKDESDHGS